MFCPLLSSLAMGVRGGVFTLTIAKLNLRLRNHLFRTLMRQEIGFFDENHTGDIHVISALLFSPPVWGIEQS